MSAGKYSTRCQWLQHSYAAADTFGEKVSTWATSSPEYVWCSVGDITSDVDDVLQDRRATVRATVRVRGDTLDIDPQDRLVDLDWAETYQVVSVSRGQNELICECYRTDGVFR